MHEPSLTEEYEIRRGEAPPAKAAIATTAAMLRLAVDTKIECVEDAKAVVGR